MEKRYYSGPSAFLRDARQLLRDLRRLRVLKGSELVDPVFRERLMLTVTEVNRCRYCAYVHARLALSAGLTQDEIQTLVAGELAGVPQDQAAAILYAQHWAESDGVPDRDARKRVEDTYGPERTEAMEIYMRMMRMGNLGGNSLDHVLSKMSFGRWGS